MSKFFQRLVGAFEVLWNTDGPEIYCVQSAPTFELVEMITGQVGLAPRRVLGVYFLPKECRHHTARFTSVGKLTHEILSFLNLPILAPGEQIHREGIVAPWVCQVDSDIVYGPVQPRNDGRSAFSRLSPEMIAAGVQSRTPLLDQGLMTMNCGWDRYIRADVVKKSFWALSQAALNRTGQLDFASPQAAAWLHFLALIEHCAPQQQNKRSQSHIVQNTFPSIYQPSAQDSVEDSVLV